MRRRSGRNRKSARSYFSSCRLSFLFMMVVRSHPNALPCAFSVERDQRPPAGAMAKSLLVVAHRDLLRSKDDADRLPGVLGIHVAGTRQSLALPQMDRCDGTVCPPQTQQILKRAHSDGTGIEKQVRHGFRRLA